MTTDADLHRLGLKLKFAYSIVGLLVGLSCIIVGMVLGLGGVAGHTTWAASLLGFSTNLNDAAPGVIVFVVGIFFVLLTRFRVTATRKTFESPPPFGGPESPTPSAKPESTTPSAGPESTTSSAGPESTTTPVLMTPIMAQTLIWNFVQQVGHVLSTHETIRYAERNPRRDEFRRLEDLRGPRR